MTAPLRILPLALLLLLCACARQADTPPQTADAPAGDVAATPPEAAADPGEQDRPLARMDGYGELMLGASADELRRSWQGELDGKPAEGSDCYYLFPAGAASPRDLAFMIEHDRFVRYDVGTDALAAPGGGKVGMGLARLQTLYREGAERLPHKYVDGGANLRVAPLQPGQGVLNFEIDADGTVTAWRVGLTPQVDYVEGCS